MFLKQIQRLQKSNSSTISKIKQNKTLCVKLQISNDETKMRQLIQDKYKFSKNNKSLKKKSLPKTLQPTKFFPIIQNKQSICNGQKKNLITDISTDYYSFQNKYRRTHKQYQNCINRINLRTTYRGFNTNSKQNIKARTDQEKNIIVVSTQTSNDELKKKYTNRIINFIIKRGIGRAKNKQATQKSDNQLQTKLQISTKNSNQQFKRIKQNIKAAHYFESGFKTTDIQPW